jgi:hypothetical protein
MHYRYGVDNHELTIAAIAFMTNVFLERYPAFEVHYNDTNVDRINFI